MWVHKKPSVGAQKSCFGECHGNKWAIPLCMCLGVIINSVMQMLATHAKYIIAKFTCKCMFFNTDLLTSPMTTRLAAAMSWQI